MIMVETNHFFGPRILETLTTALYEDPIIIFREYVQNSLDAYNMILDQNPSNELNDFCVKINFNGDKVIEIFDNGYGIPENEFLKKMTLIGSSGKHKSLNQIGFRGIGRLSAMPLCKNLKFTNKPMGSEQIYIFCWDGQKFSELLEQDDESDFESVLDDITSYEKKQYDGNENDHFFKVEIIEYKEEINELLNSTDLKDRLSFILPLRYSPNFSKQEIIRSNYNKYMGQSLDRFSIDVILNKENLYKPYSDDDILESDIIFWKLQYPSKKTDVPGEKIGLLWFSFNRTIKARNKNEISGILVRSKNMLMGDRYSLANAVTRSKSDYITTHNELTLALKGITGEMLIHSPKLNDNARRDWFRIDEASIELRNIIGSFMKGLHTYRYAASYYFSDKENDKNQEKLIKAYNELTGGYKPEKFIDDIRQFKEEIQTKKNNFEFAEEDFPLLSITLKKFYDRLIKCLRVYFLNKKDLEEFIKIRTFIKKELNEGKNI
jgi:molecular chaperone HtpG